MMNKTIIKYQTKLLKVFCIPESLIPVFYNKRIFFNLQHAKTNPKGYFVPKTGQKCLG